MKIKESDLKKIIKESVLEGLFGFGTSMSDDNQVIDLWANLFDVARDQASKEEIYKHAQQIWMAVVGMKLNESPQMWEQEIRKALSSGRIKADDLKNGIKYLANTANVGPWMKSSYGELVSSIVGSAVVPDPGSEEVGTPASGGESKDTDFSEWELTGDDIDMPTVEPSAGEETAPPRSAAASKRTPWVPGKPDPLAGDAREYINHLLQTPGVKAEEGSALDRYVVSTTKNNPNLRDISSTDIADWMRLLLKTMGVTKISESRLRQIVLEEAVGVLREIKKR